jgi:S1-C subfamily serine protease
LNRSKIILAVFSAVLIGFGTIYNFTSAQLLETSVSELSRTGVANPIEADIGFADITVDELPRIESVDHESSYSERLSRRSSVKVYHPDFGGFGSGTYAKVEGRFFILTAAHVVRGESHMLILGRDEVVPGRVVYTNNASDIAFLEVEEMNTREPIRIRNNYDPHISDDLVYTGFPNGTDLLTITGRISGFRGHWLVVQGYTWMGASGSGVFDNRGRLVGVVSMVEVGNFHRPQVIEDIVYVAKLNKADMRFFRDL